MGPIHIFTLMFNYLLAALPRRRVVTVASRLLVAIGAKLLGAHGGLHVGKCRAFGALISSPVPCLSYRLPPKERNL